MILFCRDQCSKSEVVQKEDYSEVIGNCAEVKFVFSVGNAVLGVPPLPVGANIVSPVFRVWGTRANNIRPYGYGGTGFTPAQLPIQKI